MNIPDMAHDSDIPGIIREMESHGYLADEELATLVFLLFKLHKPLLLEGHPGVGKTELAYTLAAILKTRLIRLQCYEGLDMHHSVYEWNYQKQLLSIKIHEKDTLPGEEKEKQIFSEEYLLKRPLLESISAKDQSPVLLIDEIDRADEEFEAFLLELLSVYQITIPELGTFRAIHPPFVILTSNRTRELSDALKRRCLFHWIEYPDLFREIRIVKQRLPNIEDRLVERIVSFVQQLRKKPLTKVPGIAETLDWAASLLALGYSDLGEKEISQTIGTVLKSADDIARLKENYLEELLTAS